MKRQAIAKDRHFGRTARGMTSVLAMLFLVLFGTLAIGFYAATNTATQVSANDEHVARALMAAESGMEFMKYQLAHVSIPPNTDPSNVIDELYTDLQVELNGSSNLGAMTISRSGNTIQIPGNSNDRIKLDSRGDASFHATITDWAGEIVVSCSGYYGGSEGAARAISMDFTRQQRTTSVFDYAIASRGQVRIRKGTITSINGVDPAIAAIMSAAPTSGAIQMSGGTVGGDLNIVDGGTAVVTGGTVAGSSVPANILASHVNVVDAPEFPTVDPTVYRQYATNTYVPKANLQSNILIKAGTNPKFNANDVVQGIVYIESPNVVTFNGDFKLQGFIVMESGTSTTDALNFSGNLTMTPVPNGAQFDALRATSGVAILAPNAAMTMSGSSGGGNVKGSIIVNSFDVSGAASLQIDQGTLMTLSPETDSATFEGSKSIKFSATGANNKPKAGVSYSGYFMPEPGTYEELMP